MVLESYLADPARPALALFGSLGPVISFGVDVRSIGSLGGVPLRPPALPIPLALRHMGRDPVPLKTRGGSLDGFAVLFLGFVFFRGFGLETHV